MGSLLPPIIANTFKISFETNALEASQHMLAWLSCVDDTFPEIGDDSYPSH